MSKRKLDKSASAAQSAAVPAERPPTPDPDVVEGKMAMKDWERALDSDAGSSLAAAVVMQCVDAAATILYDKYLSSEAVPHCVSHARDAMNQMLRLKCITIDAGDISVTPATYEVDADPVRPPMDNYFRGVASVGSGVRSRSDKVPAQPKAKPGQAKSTTAEQDEANADATDPAFHAMLCTKCRQEEDTLNQLRRQSLLGKDGSLLGKDGLDGTEMIFDRMSPLDCGFRAWRLHDYRYSSRNSRRPKAMNRRADCDLCGLDLGPILDTNNSISGAIGESFRAGNLPENETTLQKIEANEIGKKSTYDSLKAGMTNVSESQPTDESRVAQLHLPDKAHVKHMSELEKAVACGKQCRQDQIEMAGYEDVADISGSAFPKPVISRDGLDFSRRYRQVQRRKLDREVEAREKALRKQAAMESFQEFRARCQRESSESLQESLDSTAGLTAAPARQPTGLTAAQERALGLDSQGRARMIDIAINGRMQRPVVTESLSPR